MTNLTEQWKKGKLPSGYYYVYLKYLEMFDTVGTSTLSGILEIGNGNNVEILAPVPSYEQWRAKLEENTKLKELLKECKGLFNRSMVDGEEPNNAELIMILTKIEKVLGEE